MTDEATTPVPAPTATPAVRPGWKTSEFYLALAAMLLSALFASGLVASGSSWDKAFVFIASALTSAGYSVSRGMTKAAA